MTDVALPTEGTVWSWTTQHFAPKAPFRTDEFAPFSIGYVDLGPVIVEGWLVGTHAVGDRRASATGARQGVDRRRPRRAHLRIRGGVMNADEIYIVGAARTAFGRFDGEDNELAEQAVRGRPRRLRPVVDRRPVRRRRHQRRDQARQPRLAAGPHRAAVRHGEERLRDRRGRPDDRAQRPDRGGPRHRLRRRLRQPRARRVQRLAGPLRDRRAGTARPA